MRSEFIPVVKPHLGSLDEFSQMLKNNVWSTGIVTHHGPLVQELEKNIAAKLRLRNYHVVTNGTHAIEVALKACEIKGEIITTSFSWVATASAIKNVGCVPVFADIDEDTYNISISDIRKKITKNTKAIIPVHVFGQPCDVEALSEIGKEFNIPIIYDAAHALGSQYKDESVLSFGDLSAVSMHATKIFNSGEGGGVIVNDTTHQKNSIEQIRFFGVKDGRLVSEGSNYKMTEIHAALGLVNLKEFDLVVSDRKKNWLKYKENLRSLPVSLQKINHDQSNHSYFSIRFHNQGIVTRVIEALSKYKFGSRRYFHPTLEEISNVTSTCKIANKVSRNILCLPLYYNLAEDQIDQVCSVISEVVT